VTDESVSQSLHEALRLLKRHGVALKVPPAETLERMSMFRVQAIMNWYGRPDLHSQPEEVRLPVRLVKEAKQ